MQKSMGLFAVVLIALSVQCANRPISEESQERTVDLTYRFTVHDIPSDAERAIAWVPLPLSDRWQQLAGFHIEGDKPYTLVTDPEYRNQFLRLDLMGNVTGGEPEEVVINFRINRKVSNTLDESAEYVEAGENEPYPQTTFARFLKPDRLVPIDGKIAEEALRVAGDVEDPLERTRVLYDHIVDSVVYDKSGQGWGHGDALYVCDARTGNCTDFHSLFIGEARALGTPARFVMGLPLPPGKSEGTIPGYHCWAEFYVEGKGWMPVDASEASKNKENRRNLFGKLDANRIAFTIGRDIRIPDSSAEPINYVIYPHVEVDGKAGGRIETSFHFRDVGDSAKKG